MFILNHYTRNTILSKGLDLEKTTKQLQEISKNYEKDINFLNIEIINENELFVWLINHDEIANTYDYFNNSKAITIKPYYANYKKLVKDLIAETLEHNKNDFLRLQKPLNGYYIKELENNKPNTLLNAKNDNFIEFVVIGKYSKINEIDITPEKQEYLSYFLGIRNNYWDAKTIRKEAIAIFAVYNKDYQNYLTRCAEVKAKQEQRKQIKSDLKLFEKYSYNDESLRKLQNRYISLHLYRFSYNSLKDHRWDNCESAYIEFNGVNLNPNAQTRQEVFNYMIDKSGYFTLLNRYNLLKRAEKLKRERAEAKKEQELKEWQASDHTEQEQEVNKILTKLQNQIILRSDFNSLMNSDTFAELKKYRMLYNNIAELKNFNNYKSVSEWEKAKSDKLNELAFWEKAIIKKVIDKVAPIYKYELINGIYKMNDNDPDKFWSSRCVNEF